MKVIVEADFMCAYYWHAALQAQKEIEGKLLPRSLYHAIAAIILWQCTLESYINLLIAKHGKRKHRVHRPPPRKSGHLEKASLKEKWIHLPIALSGKQFILDAEPFVNFEKLVHMRNDLVHLDSDKLVFEKQAPAGVKTVGDYRKWLGSCEFIEGTIFQDILTIARNGSNTVSQMIQRLHQLIGGPAPVFLTGAEVIIQLRTAN